LGDRVRGRFGRFVLDDLGRGILLGQRFLSVAQDAIELTTQSGQRRDM
jgi:hypothetical protein